MRRPGFTVLELAAAAALLLILVGIAIPTYRMVESDSADNAARSRLGSIEVELARAQADNDGTFPEEIHTRIPAGAEKIVDGSTNSTGPTMLSVAIISGSAVAGATRSESGSCVVAVFTVNDEPAWGVDTTPGAGSCRASHPAIASASDGWAVGSTNSIDLS